MTTFERVYAAVRLIPCGSVATYGQIARAIGNPRLCLLYTSDAADEL